MRILQIGLGRWGRNHLRVLRELGADVWVADPAPEARERATAQGVAPERVVGDYRRALGVVEAVDVVTPADSHFALVSACLAAERHCLVEKPLAMTAAEGRRLAEAAARQGRVLQVGHILRFHPVTAALRAALAAGRIGTVRYGRCRFAGFKRPRTDVGITHTDSVHFFDLFADLLGAQATSVLAVQRDFVGRGLDDLSLSVVSFGEVPVVVEADYFVPGTYRECVIVGERGSLVADYGTGAVTLHGGEHRRTAAGWEAVATGQEALPVGSGEPLRLELEAFLAACAGRGPNLAPAGAGAHAVHIVEAAALSARLGRSVRLDEIAGA